MKNRVITSPALILASASPRRREILAAIGVNFQVIPSRIDEAPLPNELPDSYALRLARDKAADIAQKLSTGFVLGADTIVVLKNQILGKPDDEADARFMLQKLSGKWHEVFTAVAVVDASTAREASGICRTRVKFSPLTDREIEWYLQSGEPFDKAGAYAIQGRGSLFIEEIEGNYLNVVGLPVPLLRRLIESLGGRLT